MMTKSLKVEKSESLWSGVGQRRSRYITYTVKSTKASVKVGELIEALGELPATAKIRTERSQKSCSLSVTIQQTRKATPEELQAEVDKKERERLAAEARAIRVAESGAILDRLRSRSYEFHLAKEDQPAAVE